VSRGLCSEGGRTAPDSAVATPGPVAPKQRNSVSRTRLHRPLVRRGSGGRGEGYNAQAAVTVDQVIVAAEVTNDANDDAQFAPMVAATKANLRHAGCTPASDRSSRTPGISARTTSQRPVSKRSSLRANETSATKRELRRSEAKCSHATNKARFREPKRPSSWASVGHVSTSSCSPDSAAFRQRQRSR
jgi:hypothetical protein